MIEPEHPGLSVVRQCELMSISRVGRKRVRRLMAVMGLAPIYQRPRTTVPNLEHRIWPYLLRDMAINRSNQVWRTDLTYIPMRRGFP